MRTLKLNITINLYKFDELGKEAQETALNNWNKNNHEYFGDDEAMASLKAFVAHFGGELRNWDIDFLENYRNKYHIDYPELTKTELRAKIMAMGSYDKKILKGNGDCALTGVWIDEELCDGARKSYFSGERDIEKIILAGINEWEEAVKKDFEYQFSKEFFKDHCEANEQEFN